MMGPSREGEPVTARASCLCRIGDQVLAGSRVALIAGALTGLGAAAYLFGGQYSELILTGWSSRVAALAYLLSLGALAAMAALLPIELLLGCALCLSARLRQRISPRRFYATTYGVGLLATLGFLEVAFNRVRDLRSGLGTATVAGFVIVSVLAIVLFNLKAATHPWQFRGSRRSAGLWTLGAVAVLAALLAASAAWLSDSSSAGRTIAGEVATGEPSKALDEASASDRPDRPPVLLISIDTLRADRLGAYGYQRPTTPRLDAFADEAVLFERAYSPTSWTMPAHATMLTGLYPAQHGVRFTDTLRFLNSRSTDTLADDNVTLAELLSAKGYTTAAFTSMAWLTPTFGFDQGFDLFETSPSEHTAGRLVDKAIDWLEASGEEPFFLFLHYFDVHHYQSPEEYFRRFHPQDYSGKVRGRELKIMGNLWQELSPEDLTYIDGKYDGALNYVDEEVGRLLAHLEGLERYDEALVIVTSDHGEEFMDHGATGHGQTLYEEQLRIPLLLKPPYGEGGARRLDDPVALVDLVPTVLDFAGLPPFPAADGVSLRPLVRGAIGPARELHFGDVFSQNRAAILDGGYKLIVNRLPPFELFEWQRALINLKAFFKFGPDELYDLADDPAERRNVVAARPEVADRLRERLLEHQRSARSGPAGTMDAETLENLRALGYLD